MDVRLAMRRNNTQIRCKYQPDIFYLMQMPSSRTGEKGIVIGQNGVFILRRLDE